MRAADHTACEPVRSAMLHERGAQSERRCCRLRTAASLLSGDGRDACCFCAEAGPVHHLHTDSSSRNGCAVKSSSPAHSTAVVLCCLTGHAAHTIDKQSYSPVPPR